jgi:hypothetical protein
MPGGAEQWMRQFPTLQGMWKAIDARNAAASSSSAPAAAAPATSQAAPPTPEPERSPATATGGRGGMVSDYALALTETNPTLKATLGG